MIAKTLPMPRLGLPPGRRVYAIGDVHGQAERLVVLYDAIRADLARHPVRRPVLLFVGDLIDRGPNSAAVVQFVLRQTDLPTVTLMGNHESMLLGILATPDRARAERRAADWLDHGGMATLQSWGVPARAPLTAWAQHIPPAHLAFLRSRPLTWQSGGCLFVHAGVRPGFSIAGQDRQDMLYIREPFLSHRGPALPGTFVVHGHTPGARPVLRPWRLCVDTGAGGGGPLTCAVLGRDQVRFLQA